MKTFIKYGVIQACAFSIDVVFFLIFLSFNVLNPIFSNLLAKIVSGFFGFYFQRSFVFHNSQSNLIAFQAVRFIGILIINNLVQLMIMAVLINYISSPISAKIIADTSCILLSYFASKYFIFKFKKEKKVIATKLDV